MKETLTQLLKKSYAPYSKVKVAAILVLQDKQQFSGVNIENAALTPSLCAERCAIFQAVFKHGHKLQVVSIHVISSLPQHLFPCGVCLQTMCEFFSPTTKIFLYTLNSNEVIVKKFSELMPYPIRANFF